MHEDLVRQRHTCPPPRNCTFRTHELDQPSAVKLDLPEKFLLVSVSTKVLCIDLILGSSSTTEELHIEPMYPLRGNDAVRPVGELDGLS